MVALSFTFVSSWSALSRLSMSLKYDSRQTLCLCERKLQYVGHCSVMRARQVLRDNIGWGPDGWGGAYVALVTQLTCYNRPVQAKQPAGRPVTHVSATYCRNDIHSRPAGRSPTCRPSSHGLTILGLQGLRDKCLQVPPNIVDHFLRSVLLSWHASWQATNEWRSKSVA